MKISGVILAGGKSRRMGQNKSLLKIGDKTVIEIIIDKIEPLFEEIILVTNSEDDYPMLQNIRIVPDAYLSKETNSLIGLYTGLFEAKNDNAFVIPCDMPFINQKLIDYMINNIGNYDIVVPWINGYYQSLHAIYNKSTLDSIKYLFDNNIYKINRLFEEFPNLTINKIGKDILDDLNISDDCFLNLNTLEDYHRANNMYRYFI